MVRTFANVDRPNAWLVFGRQKSFATQEIQGSEVVSPCKILCSLHGYICQCLLIFTHHSLFQTKYLLKHVMVRLLTSICVLFVVLTIAIFELSVVPLNKKLLSQNHPAHENEHANYRYYKSIGGYTEGANAIFETHNSARRLIEDHLSVINGKLIHLTCLIAQLRENPDGYICINPRY